MPLFTDYQNKTKRQIPLIILTPIDGGKYDPKRMDDRRIHGSTD
jgi:hypothetical protein